MEVRTEQWCFSAKRKVPSGYGTWMFGTIREWKTAIEGGGDYFTFCGTYSECKCQAIKWAKEKGYSYIYLMP